MHSLKDVKNKPCIHTPHLWKWELLIHLKPIFLHNFPPKEPFFWMLCLLFPCFKKKKSFATNVWFHKFLCLFTFLNFRPMDSLFCTFFFLLNIMFMNHQCGCISPFIHSNDDGWILSFSDFFYYKQSFYKHSLMSLLVSMWRGCIHVHMNWTEPNCFPSMWNNWPLPLQQCEFLLLNTLSIFYRYAF